MNWKYLGEGVQIYDPVIVLKPEVVSLNDHCRVDGFVKIEGGLGVSIGRYVHIPSFCHVNIGGGQVTIGDYAALSSGAKVLGGSNQMEGESMSACVPPEMQVVKRAHTVIGAYAFLGTNAVVMPGVVIGEGAVVGAGAVVTKDVAPREIVVGVPARHLAWRERP